MTEAKRELTSDDLEQISKLWRAYGSVKRLRNQTLPSTAKGAWLREACTVQMELIARELEELFNSTY